MYGLNYVLAQHKRVQQTSIVSAARPAEEAQHEPQQHLAEYGLEM
jgi:hypothetical protein